MFVWNFIMPPYQAIEPDLTCSEQTPKSDVVRPSLLLPSIQLLPGFWNQRLRRRMWRDVERVSQAGLFPSLGRLGCGVAS